MIQTGFGETSRRSGPRSTGRRRVRLRGCAASARHPSPDLDHARLPAHDPGERRMAGAEGFEPSNTGSKVPRLTAWPRPTVMIPGAFQSWRYGSTGVAELPSANREFIR